MPLNKGLRYLKEVSRIPDISRMPFSGILDAIISGMLIIKGLSYLKEVSGILDISRMPFK